MDQQVVVQIGFVNRLHGKVSIMHIINGSDDRLLVVPMMDGIDKSN